MAGISGYKSHYLNNLDSLRQDLCATKRYDPYDFRSATVDVNSKEQLPMPNVKIHFEQVPVKIVKKIAREEFPEKSVPSTSDVDAEPQEKTEINRMKANLERTGRRMKLSSATPTCSICGKPVPLESSKSDEYGQAVHEGCAVSRLASRNHSTLPTQTTPQVGPVSNPRKYYPAS